MGDKTNPSAKQRTRSQLTPTVLLLQQQENMLALATQSARGRALLGKTPSPTGIQIQRKIDSLEKHWAECDTLHRELLSFTDDPATAQYFEDASFANARRELYILLEDLEGAFPAASLTTVQANLNSIPQAQVRPAMASLERIPVPTFDGSLKDWPNFRDLFNALIIKDESISNIYKFSYLKKSLKGNALSIIKNLELSGDNFSRAWKLITEHYQNVNSLTFSYILRLLKLEPVDSKKPGQLERLYLQTREILASLESLKEPVEHWSSLLVVLTVLRLDNDLRQDWEHSVGRRSTFPKFSELEEFLQTRIHSESLSNVKPGVSTHSINTFPSKLSKPSEPRVKYNAHVSSTSNRACVICNGLSHQTHRCYVLLKLAPNDRLSKIKSLHLCANCLCVGHLPRDCDKSVRCSKCQRRHNTILHDSFNAGNINSPSLIDANENSVSFDMNVASHTASQLSTLTDRSAGSNILLATAIVKVSSPEGRELTMRVLVDQGSERSFISESAAQQLRLVRQPVNASIVGIGNSAPGYVKHSSTVTVTSVRNQQSLVVHCLILSRLTSYAPRNYIKPGMWYHVSHLPLADVELHSNRPIDMILGADVYGDIIRDGLLRFPNEPIAQSTIFGWILSGPCVDTPSRNPSICQPPSVITSLHVTTNDMLSDSLTRFWEVEEIPSLQHLTQDERKCEEIFVNTTTRNIEGRYTVHLPFSSDLPIDIGESYDIASKQYSRLERRLARDSKLSQDYNAFLQEYLDLGHMSPYAPQSDRKQTCYIPHHPVVKESSSTTKVRVVFNASCPTTNGRSLNHNLYIGPKLQQDLSAIIMRWRLHRYAMVADAEKMFRQISVAPEHTPYQLILWRPRVNGPISSFQLNTVTYGTASAPYLSLRVLHQLAADELSDFPRAARELEQNTYVDDIVFGSSSIEETRFLRDDILALTERGCFSFRKWVSNEPTLLSDLPSELRDSSVYKKFVVDDGRKVLGTSWRTSDDSFEYSVIPDLPDILTKRSILSFIAKLFDPMGWISPVIVTSKIFMQRLWLSQLGWDEPISAILEAEWFNFIEGLVHLPALRIPRWIGSLPGSSLQLHMFCDASQHAYAAAIYIRIETEMGVITRLLVSKTKVAPLKSVTIPRLELCAAELGSRLLVWSLSSLSLSDMPCFAWSDSTVTLTWISAPPSRWKVFVANRVARIQTRCPRVSWHYVPTALNPADIASRGCSALTIIDHGLWWCGPEWLQRSRDEWPSSVPEFDSDINHEERALAVHVAHETTDNYAQRCSDWGKLIRAGSTFLRYMAILRGKIRNESTAYFVTPSAELMFQFKEQARRYWLKIAQQFCFSSELKILGAQGALPRRNRLIALSPFLDSEGLLRVGGRLEHSALLEDGKHPILLGKCHITRLIIKHAHLSTLHGGISLTSRLLAETYWIFRVKTLVKSEIQRCVSCARYRASVLSQGMAPLPSFRINRRRAFQNVGVDYAGPMMVKFGSGRGHRSHKAYICVFVCLITRAIHLELVHAYSTDAFLAAFKRFTSRRGLPSLVVSDNGTNFKGASRELIRDFKLAMSDPRIAATLAQDQVKWMFIPPGSPHFGGMWEAGVKSVKHHLRRVTGDRTLDVEEFSTLLCRIEACLNSRPIAGFSSSPDDLSYLTPGHFLIGTTLLAPPEPTLVSVKESRMSRWQAIQVMVERFWKVWSRDFLRSLQTRVKWRQIQPNLLPGSIVLLKDENLPPAKWALGRVLSCHPGSDGLVRVCQVRTASTVLTRPIHKLCLLPIEGADTCDD